MKWDDGTTDRRLSLDITPMIDVVFLLVLFFAVSTSFISAEDLTSLRDDLTSLSRDNASLRSDVATLSRDNTSLRAEVEDRTREVAALQTSLLEQMESARNLDAMLAALEARRATLQESLNEAQRDRRTLEEQLEQAARDFAALNLRLEGVGAERDRAAEQERTLRALLQERDTTNADLEAALASTLAALEQSRRASADLQAEAQAAAADLERERSAGAEAHRELAEATATLDESARARASLRARLDGREAELAEARSTRELLEEALARALAKSRQSRDAQTEFEQRERLLQALLAEKAAQYEDLEVRLVRADERNRELTSRLASLETQSQERGDDTLQLRTEILRLQAELARYRAVAELDREQVAQILEAQRRLRDGLESYLRDNRISITRDNQRLVVQLSDQVLFPSGSAEINDQGRGVLRTFGEIIKARSGTLGIQIGGHTDNVPVGARSGVLSTNWGLSAARAVNVVRFLQEEVGIDAKRLSAVGYGEHRPVASNATLEGRAANRRIEIVLVPR